MREYLDENTFFSTVLMSSGTGKLVLVVEGDDDRLALKPHISEELILLAGVGGKQSLLKAAKCAHNKAISDVRFLIDRDYDDYALGPMVLLENVVYTSAHDMFIDIAISDPSLLLRIIEVKTASVRRKNNGSSIPDNDDIVADAISLAAHLGAIRIVSVRRELPLTFRDFPFGEIKPKEVDVQIIAKTVLRRSKSKNLNIEDEVILNESKTVRDEIDQEYSLIGDHDLFAALASVLRSLGVYVKADDLQDFFIVTIDCNSLLDLEWFQKINEWGLKFKKKTFNCKND